jgi:hypothetical protein
MDAILLHWLKCLTRQPQCIMLPSTVEIVDNAPYHAPYTCFGILPRNSRGNTTTQSEILARSQLLGQNLSTMRFIQPDGLQLEYFISLHIHNATFYGRIVDNILYKRTTLRLFYSFERATRPRHHAANCGHGGVAESFVVAIRACSLLLTIASHQVID